MISIRPLLLERTGGAHSQSRHQRPDTRTQKNDRREHGRGRPSPHRIPHIGQQASTVRQRTARKEPAEEASDQECSHVRGEGLSEMEEGVADEGDDVDQFTAEEFRAGTPEDRTEAIAAMVDRSERYRAACEIIRTTRRRM